MEVIYRSVAIKFLLMCYSSLRFGDAMTFNPAVHVIGNDRIYTRTEKASTILNPKFYNRLSRIITFLQAYPLPA